MTGVQEPDLREQPHGPTQEAEDEEEEGEMVHVSVEGEQLEHKEEEEEEEEGMMEEEEEEREKEELPYPSLAPVVLLALTQTSPPRSWCLRVVCHPYPSPLLTPDTKFFFVYNVRGTLSVPALDFVYRRQEAPGCLFYLQT